MKIAVLGATGTAGRQVLDAAQQAGHQTVGLSRASGVNVHTGEGLEGMSGSEVLIDVSNPFPSEPDANLVDVFSAASTRVAKAAYEVGVQHLVHVSICNIDKPAFGLPPEVGPRVMRAAVSSMGTDFSILSRAAVPER